MSFIECNLINGRKRYVCLYQNEPLKNYSISAVPMQLDDDKAYKLIDYLNTKKSKLNGEQLRRFNKSIAYLKLVKEI